MAESHPNRNILLTSLGGTDMPRIEFADMTVLQTRLKVNDSFLLCSDGLWAYFGEEELGQIISSTSAKEATARLIELARARGAGGGDNISLALLKFYEERKQYNFRTPFSNPQSPST
jgi:serine/threonine protein phosphatase PrpC